MPDRPIPEVVLIVGSDRSFCSCCGFDADNREITHRRVPDSSRAGCGARFTAIRPELPFPTELLNQVMAQMRPNLKVAT